jgi:hypothetical protein
LLKATSLAAAIDALVRVKSHYLKALELEVHDAAMVVMDTLDYECDDREE